MICVSHIRVHHRERLFPHIHHSHHHQSTESIWIYCLPACCVPLCHMTYTEHLHTNWLPSYTSPKFLSWQCGSFDMLWKSVAWGNLMKKYYKCKLLHVTILEDVGDSRIWNQIMFPIADVQIHQIKYFAEKYSNMCVNTWSRFPLRHQ